MILQALYEYYQRKPDLPKDGFENKEFKFIIVINADGTFVDLIDKREGRKGKEYLVPKSTGRAGSNSWQTTSLLWDHYGYVLAYPKDDSKKSIEMAEKQNSVFIDTIKNLPDYIKKDTGIKAVLSFYEKEQIEVVKKHSNWEDCARIKGCNLSFQLDGDEELIPQRPIVTKYQESLFTSRDLNNENIDDEDKSKYEATCLITGNRSTIARTHSATPIKGSKSNAKLVSFQKGMGFNSYNKEQAFNAPISITVESSYTTALKFLLNSPANKVTIADSTVTFWAERESTSFNLETELPWYFSDPPKDDPDRGVNAVRALFDSIQSGQLPKEKNNRFYILGLSPNAARIAVRFWKVGTVWEIGEKIKMHFDDFNIEHGPAEPEYLCLNKILRSVVLEYKMENVPPNLAGAVITSILDGSPYPLTLLQQCIRRIRAERHVNRARASILKAYINRYNRINNTKEKEIKMALDISNTIIGYRLGRLFATLEKIQEEASPGINATIRDRYYGSASSSPVTVFSQLLKLKNHHLAKLDTGRKIYFEKLIGEVVSELSSFPANLSLNDQAYFSVGYYHQRQDFFTSKKNQNESDQK